MKEKKTIISLFILVFALAILVNTASAGIKIIDAEATYEANLSSVSVPIEPISVKSIFTCNEDALLKQVLFRVRIPTLPVPIKDIFIINEDAAFDTSLFAVNIPTEPSPIKKIFAHLEDAKAYEDLIFPIKLINDVTSPIITNITVTNITDNSAMVKWDTNEIADSLVKYGKASGIYTEIERNPLFVGNHTIALAKLSSGTTYYFVVNSTDRSGNSAESLEYSFTTTGMINQPPIASFTYSPAHPGVNQTVAFNATDSCDLDGTIVSYEWDFGEGTNGTGEIVEHSYPSPGNYTVNLTVTDDSNSENYTSFIIPVRPGLSKPINMDAVEEVYPLDPAAKDKLFNNGFVVLKDHEHGNISDCYWDLFFREDVSVFITSDAMLHIFHVVHDDMLRDIEKQYLYNSTELLVQDMQRKSMQEYENTSSNLTYVKEAARRNVVFFTVACKLLNDTYPVPSCAEENVTEYVQKILNHSAAEFYPGDDYTQYEPRGHYEGDPTLENYFRGMKWLSRRIFRIEDYKYPEDSHLEMIQAVMISGMLQESPTDMQLWGKVYNVTTLLVGTADSITPVMVQKAVSNVFPTNFTLSQLENATNIEKLRTEFKKAEYPESQIIPVPLEYPGQIPPKYVQFMGGRYVPDGYVFQQDTYPYISDVTRLPKGLEVMATMLGSNRADQLLEEEKQTYPELGSQMNKLKTEFENYTAEDWKKNVYCNWFYTLDPLLVEFNQSYPVFMQTEAWQDEKLNTALSSWTQLRHDYILYAKQTYVPAPWAAGYGYVEPIPEFYNRLASLCRKIDTELSNEDVLPQKYHDHFSSLANELDKFEKYSQKIVDNQTLTIEEQGDIHRFGLWLLGFFMGGIKEEEPTLVADVCTNSFTGKVLHEGVGKFNPIIIVYEQPDGITLAGIGFVMSYYEFTEENFNRITDNEWKERAEKGTLPPRPFWANSFLYNVTLTAKDSDGATNTTSKTIAVSEKLVFDTG